MDTDFSHDGDSTDTFSPCVRVRHRGGAMKLSNQEEVAGLHEENAGIQFESRSADSPKMKCLTRLLSSFLVQNALSVWGNCINKRSKLARLNRIYVCESIPEHHFESIRVIIRENVLFRQLYM